MSSTYAASYLMIKSMSLFHCCPNLSGQLTDGFVKVRSVCNKRRAFKALDTELRICRHDSICRPTRTNEMQLSCRA